MQSSNHYDFIGVWDLNGTLDHLGEEKAMNLMDKAQKLFASEGLGKIGFVVATGSVMSDNGQMTNEMRRLFEAHPAILGIKEIPSGPYTPNPAHPEGDPAVLGTLAQNVHKILIDNEPDAHGFKCFFVAKALGVEFRKPSIITYTEDTLPEQLLENLYSLAVTHKLKKSGEMVQPVLC